VGKIQSTLVHTSGTCDYYCVTKGLWYLVFEWKFSCHEYIWLRDLRFLLQWQWRLQSSGMLYHLVCSMDNKFMPWKWKQ